MTLQTPAPRSVRNAVGRGASIAIAAGLLGTTACDAPSSSGGFALTTLPDFVTLERDVRIDGYAENLVPIGSAALRPDGVLAFGQFQDARVLVYDAEGRRIAEFGSRGEGPGEFQLLGAVGWLDDRLWIDDARQRRLTWIEVEPEPRMVGELTYRSLGPTEASGDRPGFRSVRPVGAYPDGSLLASAGGAIEAPSFDSIDVLLRIDTVGVVLGMVGSWPSRSGMVSLAQREGENTVRQIAASAPWALRSVEHYPGHAGSAAVAITDAAPGPTALVRVLSFDPVAGDTAFDATLRLAARTIPSRVADSVLEARIEGFGERVAGDWPEFAEVYRREVGIPPIFPVVSGVTKGVDGRVWLRLHPDDPAQDSSSYLVLDATGRPEFRTGVPIGTITVAAGDHVWVSETDSLGVGSLVRYTLPQGR